MKKIKIGIPRAFLYYRYYILWKTYFEKLGCTIVLSPETNKEIINLGINNSPSESCLSYKIYLGHIISIIDKCDYILVPRILDYGKKDKVCVKFNALYDIIHNTYPNINILNYNIEYTKYNYELLGFIKMGLKINKNIFKIINSYIIAKRKEKKYNKSLINSQNNNLSTNRIKILIISHPYNIYDKYIGDPIIKYLKQNNIELIFADKLDKKTANEYSSELSPTLYWKYSKELVGALNYYKNIVDGIIFISTFPCGCDSLVNELMLRKIKNKPIINIIIDETSLEVGLETRLESFIDLIKERSNND